MSGHNTNMTCPFCRQNIPELSDSCPVCGKTLRGTGVGYAPKPPAAQRPGPKIPPPPAHPSHSPSFIPASRPSHSSGYDLQPPQASAQQEPSFDSRTPPSTSSPSTGAGFGGHGGSPPPPGENPAPRPSQQTDKISRQSKPVSGRLRVIAAVVIVVLIILLSMGARYTGCGLPRSCASDSAEALNLGWEIQSDISRFHPLQKFNLSLAEPGWVALSVNGDFDSVLELYREESEEIWAEDDDSGEEQNARIERYLPSGDYVVLVRGFTPTDRGEFSLRADRFGETEPFPPDAPPQTLEGRVSEVEGLSTVSQDAACLITVVPHQGGVGQGGIELTCQIQISCGNTVIYPGNQGRGGFNRCLIVSGRPSSVIVHDNEISVLDGDPRLDLDAVAEVARLSDASRDGSVSWNVTIDITGVRSSSGSPSRRR